MPSAEIVGLDKLAEALKALVDRPRKDFRKAVRVGSNIIRKEMRAQAPKGETKKLSRSIRYKIKAKGDEVVSRIAPKKFTARFAEKGTRPRTIKTKNARVLSDGSTIYGTEVQHPGARSQPFIRSSHDASKGEAQAAMADVLKQSIKEAIR